MSKSQGRKELAQSLQPIPWTLALCLAMANTPLRTVDSKVSPNRMRTDSMMVSAQEGQREVMFLRSCVQMAAPGLLLGVREQRPLQLCLAVSVSLFFTSLPPGFHLFLPVARD